MQPKHSMMCTTPMCGQTTTRPERVAWDPGGTCHWKTLRPNKEKHLAVNTDGSHSATDSNSPCWRGNSPRMHNRSLGILLRTSKRSLVLPRRLPFSTNGKSPKASLIEIRAFGACPLAHERHLKEDSVSLCYIDLICSCSSMSIFQTLLTNTIYCNLALCIWFFYLSNFFDASKTVIPLHLESALRRLHRGGPEVLHPQTNHLKEDQQEENHPEVGHPKKRPLRGKPPTAN